MPIAIRKRPTRRVKSKPLPPKTVKRPVKAKPRKRKVKAPKLDLFAAKCDDLCNRLQADADKSIIADLLDHFGIEGGGLQELTEAALIRHPMTVTSRQFEPHFAVSSYIHSPDVGHKMAHAPKKYVVFSSNELWLSVIIAYIRLSKHAGKFL